MEEFVPANCISIPYLYDCSHYIPGANSINICTGDGTSGVLRGWWALEYGNKLVQEGKNCGPLRKEESEQSGLQTRGIIGIVIAAIFAFLGTTVAIIVCICMCKKKWQGKEMQDEIAPSSTSETASKSKEAEPVANKDALETQADVDDSKNAEGSYMYDL